MEFPLHGAVKRGAVTEVCSLLEPATFAERSQLLNAPDTEGCTPLLYGLEYGNVDVAVALMRLSAGEDRSAMLFAHGLFGRTVFHCAAERGDEAVVEEILALATSPEERSQLLATTTKRGGWTALHLAAHKGRPNVVRTLLVNATAQERCSMLAAEDHQGCTAFFVTVPFIGGDEECLAAMLLLEHSPPEEWTMMLLSADRQGRTLLHHLAEKGQAPRVEALLALARAPEDRSKVLAAVSAEGWTGLHVAAYHGAEATARVLLEHGGPRDRSKLLRAKDLKGRTAFQLSMPGQSLSMSSNCNCPAVAMLLLAYGTAEERSAMLSTKGQSGRSLLHHLALAGEEEKVQALLAATSGPEEQARLVAAVAAQDWTPLHSASFGGHAGIVRLLLEHAGTEERTRMLAPAGVKRQTPLHLAMGPNVKDDGATFCTLLTAATDYEAQKLLLARDKSGETALQCTKRENALPDRKLSFKILCWSDQRGKTLLHYSAENADMTNIDALLHLAYNARERCKRLAVQDAQGWTPLHRAAYFGHERVCKAFLDCTRSSQERSRMLAERTSEGWTALHFAQAGGVDLQ